MMSQDPMKESMAGPYSQHHSQTTPPPAPKGSELPDNSALVPFTVTHPDAMAVDLSLGGLDDPGVLADVDRHRVLITEEATLRRHEAELQKDWFKWRNKVGPVHNRLIAAKARARLHPYLTNQIPLPIDEHRPEAITVTDALLLNNRLPQFHLPMPWLAGEERPGAAHWVRTGGT